MLQTIIAPIRVPSHRTDSELEARFNDATRKLLWSRLLVAAVSLLSLSTVLGLATVLANQRLTVGSLLVVAALSGLVFYLRSQPDRPLSELRIVELIVLLVPLTHALFVLVVKTEEAIEAGTPSIILALRPTIGAAIGLLLAVYGLFIPSTWKRTALIAGAIACLQPLVIFFHSQFSPQVALVQDANFGTPILTFFAAGIATLAAHVVHNIRHEVEESRSYGQYRLSEEIGRGGMGIVYRAEHRLLKRPAAIKLIRPEVATDENAIGDFEREVQLSATLSHWNTVQIYDYGITASSDFYYVMEYLEGFTLRQKIESSRSLSVDETLAIVTQICAGLTEAHDKGMVHRDLKPENIFLAHTGGCDEVVKIVDFGLAIVTSTVSPSDERRICGTPRYMSPEQALAEDIRPASDVYAVGCILFECLTGQPAFNGKSVTELLNKQVSAQAPLEDVPKHAARLRPVIKKCLKKIASDRYQDARELNEALDGLNNE